MDFTGIRNVLVLTGAGVSAESGLATFRGPDGLWEGHRVEDVATPEAFRRDPALVQRFYDARRAKLAAVEPNAAHRALARLDAEWAGELLLVTQNVDDLHERAGPKRCSTCMASCSAAGACACDERLRWAGPMRDGPPCPSCGAAGELRPDIVWFGEMPYEMERIDEALRACRPVRLDRHFGRGLSGGGVRPDGALLRRADARDQPRAEPGSMLVRRKPHRAGGRAGAGVGRSRICGANRGAQSGPLRGPISR